MHEGINDFAVKEGCRNILLSSQFSFESVLYSCRFAVHVAISQKAVNVMKILLAHKANIDRATGEYQKVPEMDKIAWQCGSFSVVVWNP